MPIEIWIPIQIRNPIKYDGENFFTTASFGLILLWVVVVSCVAMCVRITLSHSFSPFHSSVLNREMRFIKWRRKTSTAMECTFQAPKKIDIISLAWKRNATQQQHIRRNGNFTWKCSRLVIILNRDHFLSLHLSLSQLFRDFFVEAIVFNFKLRWNSNNLWFCLSHLPQVIPCGCWLAWKNLFKNYGCEDQQKNEQRKESPQRQQCLENA